MANIVFLNQYYLFLSLSSFLSYQITRHKCTNHKETAWNVCVPACRTPLHAAAFAEDVAGLQLVLRHGTEINTVDKSGRSALMVAADKGHSGTVGKCFTQSVGAGFLRVSSSQECVAVCSTSVLGLNRCVVLLL